MKRTLITLTAAAATALSAVCAESPLWLRDAKVSPDGNTIVFRYKGDLFTVPVKGGEARRITAISGMEKTPLWSPDSSMIAFASDRDGAMNLYVMSAKGGAARQLTFGSTNVVPEAFTPDGKAVLYSASIQDPVTSRLFPTARLTELYSVPVEGGASVQILASPAESISYLPDGKSFLYQDQKGMEDVWRKHHTSSVTRDIWKYDAQSGKHTNLTARGGEDRNPVVAPDGHTVYFLSERDGGSMNVYAFDLTSPGKVTAVTNFKDAPVRFLSMGSNGNLVYTYDGEIYTQQPSGSPQKLDIAVVDDLSEQPEFVALGDYSFGTPSPDGSELALISRGEVFVTSADYATTKQVSKTPGMEMEVSWHPEGRKLLYTSQRDGHWNIYEASIARDEEPNFSNATIINEHPVFKSDGVDRTGAKYSPDGKKIVYLQNRDSIMVIDVASGKSKALTDGNGIYSRSLDTEYHWSPDSRWIVTFLNTNQHEPYYDVVLINAESGEQTNLTGTGYFDYNPRWALDGNAIIFESDRYGMRSHASWGSQSDVMIVFLNQEAMDRFMLDEEEFKLLSKAEEKAKEAKESDKDNKKKKDKKKKAGKDKKADDSKAIKVELDGIRDRVLRLTPNSSNLGDFVLVGEDGKEVLYYMSNFEDGFDLWKVVPRKGDVSIAEKLNGRNMKLATDVKGKTMFMIGSNTLKKMDLASESVKPVKVSGKLRVDAPAEREAMYDFAVREVKERFYVPDMNGVDWAGLAAQYRRYLPHITNNYDFAEMLSELLGELNVSHTGSRFFPDGSKEPSAVLGLLYDMTYTGPGMKVAEVVKGTPFNRASSKLRPGMIIEKINGEALTDSVTMDVLLKRAAKTNTLVSIYDPASGKRFEEVVKPISRGTLNDKLYDRWVERNQALVDSLSGGRLGYVHLRNMTDDSFRTIYADMLGRYYQRDGMIIDTRWNGGGRLHEDIEVLLSGDKYMTQMVHGKKAGEMPSRRWNKPSIMLICEANYSNAHGTPWVYKHKGLGKLVGAPVPGTMTSVNWIDLQDPSMLFGVPVVGMQLADGSFLENQQLEPDILVLNDPATVVTGTDRQIEIAVSELLNQLK